jgi:alkylhydroperoxidase family enzyme
LQDRIFAGPAADGLTERQRALLTAVDEFVLHRDLSDAAFDALSAHLSQEQIIEFFTLASHYDAIAAILAALRVRMDFPD